MEEGNEGLLETNTIISLYLSGKKLGLAVFDEATGAIKSDGFTIEDPSELFETVIELKRKFESPMTLFLLPPSVVANVKLLEFIRTGLDLGSDFLYPFKTVKSASWSANTAQETICKLLFVKELWYNGEGSVSDLALGQASLSQNYLRVSSAIDFDSAPLKQALAALVMYMAENGISSSAGFVVISTLRHLDLILSMYIDTQSMKALEIFTHEGHPNIIKSRGQGKEGFSLFGLFDRTMSSPGRARLRAWMKQPFYDKERIVQRQDGVGLTSRPENLDIMQVIGKNLKAVYSISNILLRIKRVVATHIDWYRLHQSLTAGEAIIECLSNFIESEGKEPREKDYARSLLDRCNLQSIRSAIELLNGSIDFRISMTEGILYLKDGFNGELDSLRDVYDNLDAVLTESAHAILQTTPLLSRVSVEYDPNHNPAPLLTLTSLTPTLLAGT